MEEIKVVKNKKRMKIFFNEYNSLPYLWNIFFGNVSFPTENFGQTMYDFIGIGTYVIEIIG